MSTHPESNNRSLGRRHPAHGPHPVKTSGFIICSSRRISSRLESANLGTATNAAPWSASNLSKKLQSFVGRKIEKFMQLWWECPGDRAAALLQFNDLDRHVGTRSSALIYPCLTGKQKCSPVVRLYKYLTRQLKRGNQCRLRRVALYTVAKAPCPMRFSSE